MTIVSIIKFAEFSNLTSTRPLQSHVVAMLILHTILIFLIRLKLLLLTITQFSIMLLI